MKKKKGKGLFGTTKRKAAQRAEKHKKEYYDESEEKTICHLIENTIDVDMNNAISSDNTGLIECDKYVFIRNCNKGYYASTPKDFYMCSDYYESLESLKNSGIVDLMNNIYLSNSKVAKCNEDEEEDFDE